MSKRILSGAVDGLSHASRDLVLSASQSLSPGSSKFSQYFLEYSVNFLRFCLGHNMTSLSARRPHSVALEGKQLVRDLLLGRSFIFLYLGRIISYFIFFRSGHHSASRLASQVGSLSSLGALCGLSGGREWPGPPHLYSTGLLDNLPHHGR